MRLPQKASAPAPENSKANAKVFRAAKRVRLFEDSRGRRQFRWIVAVDRGVASRSVLSVYMRTRGAEETGERREISPAAPVLVDIVSALV